MSLLVALAGPSRSGKGTGARVFARECDAKSVTHRERQLSGPGKHYLASAWRPDITEDEAIAWWEEMKSLGPSIDINGFYNRILAEVPLQRYMQRMLQGARDRWGESFWTDQLLPLGRHRNAAADAWLYNFMVSGDHLAPLMPPDSILAFPDIAIISDLRQPIEAQRVKDLGGIVIELHRPDSDDPYRTGKDHVTEQPLPADLVDFRVNNTGTLEDLEAIFHAYFHHDLLPRISNA